MPITDGKTPKHLREIAFIFNHIPLRNGGPAKIIFVINQIHKVQDHPDQVGQKVNNKQKFLIASLRINSQWKH